MAERGLYDFRGLRRHDPHSPRGLWLMKPLIATLLTYIAGGAIGGAMGAGGFGGGGGGGASGGAMGPPADMGSGFMGPPSDLAGGGGFMGPPEGLAGGGGTPTANSGYDWKQWMRRAQSMPRGQQQDTYQAESSSDFSFDRPGITQYNDEERSRLEQRAAQLRARIAELKGRLGMTND